MTLTRTLGWLVKLAAVLPCLLSSGCFHSTAERWLWHMERYDGPLSPDEVALLKGKPDAVCQTIEKFLDCVPNEEGFYRVDVFTGIKIESIVLTERRTYVQALLAVCGGVGSVHGKIDPNLTILRSRELLANWIRKEYPHSPILVYDQTKRFSSPGVLVLLLFKDRKWFGSVFIRHWDSTGIDYSANGK